jgi:hypothetical protein
MSDDPFTNRPQLMSAVRARDLARHFKGFAESLRRDSFTAEANQAERDAHWWLNYAIALSQIPPGRVDDDGR